MKFIDTDEAAELTIRCKANRSFALSVNLSRNLTGKTHKLQVDTDPVLTFSTGDGLTVAGTSISLTKTPAQMGLPTGTYRYDLVEFSGANADNILQGWFIIEPAITALT